MIKTEAARSITTITLDRPDKANALTEAMLRDLIDALDPVSYTHLTLPTKA